METLPNEVHIPTDAGYADRAIDLSDIDEDSDDEYTQPSPSFDENAN